MIEVRTYAGDADELSAFAHGVWKKCYEGKMLLPLWSPALLHRELFSHNGDGRQFVVAAYDGARLVGIHPTKPTRIRLHDREVQATWGSFLSVDPDYHRQGVAHSMQAECVRRHREMGVAVSFGYLYVRSGHSMGPKFWRRHPGDNQVVCKLGTWVRALDHTAVARFERYLIEAWGTRFLSCFQGPPRPPSDLSGIRPYRAQDLAACRELVQQAGDSADLVYLWDDAALERQLCFPNLSRTVVLEQDECVAGLVNYTLMEVLGKCPLLVALIDLMAFGTLSGADRRRLLVSALAQMREDGAQGVMRLRGSGYGNSEMWATGFWPQFPEYHLIATPMQDDLALGSIHKLQILWR